MDLVDGLENLTQLVMTSQSVLRGKYRDIHTNDSSLRICASALVPRSKSYGPPRSRTDHVMLADILCTELPEALQEMPITHPRAAAASHLVRKGSWPR